MKQKNKAYNWIIDLLGIPKNKSKDGKGTQIIVFKIEIDISIIIAKLPAKQLDKTVKAIAKNLYRKVC